MPFCPPPLSCKFSLANKVVILLDLQLYGNKRLGYENDNLHFLICDCSVNTS